MAKIIESIPNISEGRNKEVIEACVDQIRKTPGCTLLDYSSDPSHNRTVITCLLYTSPSPRDTLRSRMPSSA